MTSAVPVLVLDMVDADHLVENRLDRCYAGRSVHVGLCLWVTEHALEGFRGWPLRIISFVPPIKASVDVG